MRIELAKIQKRITRRDDRLYGIINYDRDNAYPQRVQDIVNGSGIAKSCVDIFFKFINGNGFEDATFGKYIIDGHRLTADKLLRKNSADFARFGGFAVHFNYNISGQVTTVSCIPFSHCRLGIDEKTREVNKIAVYDDWGRERDKKIDKDKIDYIHLYNPDPKVIKEQIKESGGIEKYKGQVYYHGADGELVYPLAPYDAELEDIETDSQIKLFKYRNISGSFMASHMIILYGQSEGGSAEHEDSNIVPLGGRENSARWGDSNQDDEFIKGIKEFQGAENFNRLMVINADTKEQKPDVIPFTHQNNDKLFEYHEVSTQNNIRKVFAIPTVFLDAIPGSLGLSKELEDAVTFYNKMTNDERAVLEESYQMLFSEVFSREDFMISELDFSINTTNGEPD